MKIDKKTIVSLVVAFLLISSMLGFFIGNQDQETFTYNEYLFRVRDDHLEFKDQGNPIKVYNYPSELENIPYNNTATNLMKSTKMLYITTPVIGTDLEYLGLASYEIAQFFSSYDVYAIQSISDDNSDYKRPLITCENSTQVIPVVYIDYANKTEVQVDGTCIKVKASTGFDAVALRDLIILKFVGVI